MQIRSFPSNDRDPGGGQGKATKPKLEVRSIDIHKAGHRRRRRRPAPKGPSLLWIRVVTLSLLALAGFLIFGLPPLMRQRGENVVWTPPANLEVASTPAPVSLQFPSPSPAEVSRLVKKVAGNQRPEDFDAYARLKDVGATEASLYLTKLAETHGGIKQVSSSGPVPAAGIQLEAARVSFLNANVRDRAAFLTPDSEGNWQMDLASFMAKSSIDWTTFCDSSTEEGLLRVSATRSNYYNGDFTDKEWACFEIRHPESDQVLMGYAAIGSPAERALSFLLKGRPAAMVILKAHKVPSHGNRQAVITSVLSDTWVLTDEAYDEDFQVKSPSQ
jgi:hypothetical protein